MRKCPYCQGTIKGGESIHQCPDRGVAMRAAARSNMTLATKRDLIEQSDRILEMLNKRIDFLEARVKQLEKTANWLAAISGRSS